MDEPDTPTDEGEEGTGEDTGTDGVKEDGGEYGTGDIPPFDDER